jgi:asparagine synthase (glutamine-hydrolysing)
MAGPIVSSEARLPLFDHWVVEFACTLPIRCKIRAGQGKRALRQVLQRYIPRERVKRPKSGFGIPLGTWLRVPLLVWAESILDLSGLCQEGYSKAEAIEQK